jgi:uncharacterized protein YfaA (DUF2138 family)
VSEDVVLVDPREDLRNGDDEQTRQARALAKEVIAEVSDGHPVYGRSFTIIARSHARDDVLLEARRLLGARPPDVER